MANGSQPHVVVVATQGWGLRNSLYSGYLQKLTETCRVTLAARPDIVPAEFAKFAPDVTVSGVPPQHERYTATGIHRVISRVRHLEHDQRVRKNNSTFRAKLRHGLIRPRPSGLLGGVCKAVCAPFAIRSFRRSFNTFDDIACAKSPFGSAWTDMFRSLNPDVVHMPSILFAEEAAVTSVARRMRIPICGAVLSWDNLSSKAPYPGPCDRTFVWSDHMQQELLQTTPLTDPKSVIKTGPLQFDWHLSPQWKLSREELCGKIGLDPERPFLLYAFGAPMQAPEEHLVVEALSREARSGALATFGPQIVARLHPKCSAESAAELGKLPSVVVNHPNLSGDLHNWQPTSDDIRLWVNMIHHSSVVGNIFSTATLDAIVQNKPVVNFAWSPDPANPWPGTLAREYTHFAPVVSSGASPVVSTLEEGIERIAEYLRDPTVDDQHRLAIRETLCGPHDGLAHKRTAAAITSLAQSI